MLAHLVSPVMYDSRTRKVTEIKIDDSHAHELEKVSQEILSLIITKETYKSKWIKCTGHISLIMLEFTKRKTLQMVPSIVSVTNKRLDSQLDLPLMANTEWRIILISSFLDRSQSSCVNTNIYTGTPIRDGIINTLK
jgi:hypothetical protein